MNETPVKKAEILVVDDSRVIRLAAKKMLAGDYEIHLAEDGLIGWEILQHNSSISVVFTDLSMPNLGGMELLEYIRNSDNEQIAELPVIILTGDDDSEDIKQAVFDAGATDFIGKPFESIDLVSRAQSYARLSRKVAELEKNTSFDKLTGLYNAAALEEQGAKAIAFSSRHKLPISAVCFEIQDFQDCFLSYGKNVAQHIIVAIGKRLKDAMREEDVAARAGVAKYVLILPMTNKQQAEIVINRVCESINRLVFDTGNEKIRVNFYAGYTAPDITEALEFKDLLDQAEEALLSAMSLDDSVVCFSNEVGASEVDSSAGEAAELPAEVTEQDIELAFIYIRNGEYSRVPEQHLNAVVGRLTPFIQYVDNQLETGSAASAINKTIAL